MMSTHKREIKFNDIENALECETDKNKDKPHFNKKIKFFGFGFCMILLISLILILVFEFLYYSSPRHLIKMIDNKNISDY